MANKYHIEGNLARKVEKKRIPKKIVSSSENNVIQILDDKTRKYATIVCISLLVSVLSLVFSRCYIANAGYSLDKLHHSLVTINQENERLRLDIAKLKAPERIQYIATTQLGMVLPAKVYYAHKLK